MKQFMLCIKSWEKATIVAHTTAKHYKVFDFSAMAHSEAMDIQAQGFSEHEEMQKIQQRRMSSEAPWNTHRKLWFSQKYTRVALKATERNMERSGVIQKSNEGLWDMQKGTQKTLKYTGWTVTAVSPSLSWVQEMNSAEAGHGFNQIPKELEGALKKCKAYIKESFWQVTCPAHFLRKIIKTPNYQSPNAFLLARLT